MKDLQINVSIALNKAQVVLTQEQNNSLYKFVTNMLFGGQATPESKPVRRHKGYIRKRRWTSDEIKFVKEMYTQSPTLPFTAAAKLLHDKFPQLEKRTGASIANYIYQLKQEGSLLSGAKVNVYAAPVSERLLPDSREA